MGACISKPGQTVALHSPSGSAPTGAQQTAASHATIPHSPGHRRQEQRRVALRKDLKRPLSPGADNGQLKKQPNLNQYRFFADTETNGIFSNFWSGQPLTIDGATWQTVEHYFQMQKFSDLSGESALTRGKKAECRQAIAKTKSPGHAQKIAGGNFDKVTSAVEQYTWHSSRKMDVMHKAVFAKFSTEPMRSKLNSTGNAVLIEEIPRTRNDTFWGAKLDQSTGRLKGANVLGQILMTVRQELKDGMESYKTNSKFNTNEEELW